MSVRVMSMVWDNFNRGGSEKLAMLALADWCNDTGDSLHPSIAGVAKKINCSQSQARRILHGFIEDGFLQVVGNHQGGNPGQARQYKLNVEMLATPSIDATPSAHATPSMDARLPLAPMRETPSTHASLTTNKPSIKPLLKNIRAKDLLSALNIDPVISADWIELRKQKKASITQTAIDGISREAVKAGLSLQDALRICCERGWAGFKAEWVADKKPANKHTALVDSNRAAINEWLKTSERVVS